MLAPYRRTVLRRAPEDGGRNYERYSRDPDVHKKYGRAWGQILSQQDPLQDG